MLVTDRTGQDDISRVYDFMSIEAPGLAETFTTICTLKRFVLGVNVSVISQMILSSKRFSAHITGKWSFICMGPLVNHKIVGFGKLTVAELTDKSFLGSRGSRIQTAYVLGRVQPVSEEEGGGEVGHHGVGVGHPEVHRRRRW